MAYVKNIWVDQDVERPKTYEVTNNQDGSITLTDSFGLVTELGTPVNEVNMNHIEDGIYGCAIRKHNLTETFNLGEWVLGGTGDDEGIYKSLIANNVGNAITDDTKWEKVEMGGATSLHALKSYEDAGELLTDAEGLADVTAYAHSTFDLAKFTNEGVLITDNGIASGFASGNSLLVTDVFSPQNTWEIRGSFVTPASISGNQTIITTTVTYGTRVRLYTNYKIGFMASSNNSSYDIAGDGFTGTNALQASTKYYFRFQFTGTQYILSTSTDNITWTQQCFKNSTSKIYTITTTQLRWGKAGGQYEIFGGSIDLKDFEVHEDGIPVINGNKTGTDSYTINNSTVIIPYILSKTGSKIVDSYYRTQVANVYNYQGYAPYYTLSVTDFTLPQGEIYGLMQKNALNGMMPDYANGIEITNALPYTVVDNGYVNIYLPTTAVNQTISVTRNNVSTIVAEKYNYANVYSSGDSNMIPVGPGDIIDSSTTTMTDAVITYFPLLGGI